MVVVIVGILSSVQLKSRVVRGVIITDVINVKFSQFGIC